MSTQKMLLSIIKVAAAAGYEADLDVRCPLCVHSQHRKCDVIVAYEKAASIPIDHYEIAIGAKHILRCLFPDRESGRAVCTMFWPTMRRHP